MCRRNKVLYWGAIAVGLGVFLGALLPLGVLLMAFILMAFGICGLLRIF